MHLGVIRQTTGFPLYSLSSHSSHNPHLLSPFPPPAMTTEWNLNSWITPVSSPLPPPPILEQWAREDGVSGDTGPVLQCLCVCDSTPSDNNRRDRRGWVISYHWLLRMSSGRSVSSVWFNSEEVLIRLEMSWFKNKREEICWFLFFLSMSVSSTGRNCCQTMMMKMNMMKWSSLNKVWVKDTYPFTSHWSNGVIFSIRNDICWQKMQTNSLNMTLCIHVSFSASELNFWPDLTFLVAKTDISSYPVKWQRYFLAFTPTYPVKIFKGELKCSQTTWRRWKALDN